MMITKFITKIVGVVFFITNYAYAQNILISTVGNPNEPAITMDIKNPRYLVAGANINSCYHSQDTGRTWIRKNITSTYGVWGDPSFVIDTAGHYYFFHLSNPGSPGYWIDRIVCQKSTDKGVNWNNGSFTGLTSPKNQDKEWCAVDRTTNNIYITWTEFDIYGSTSNLDSTRILFSKTTDGGTTWSSPVKINGVSGDCVDSDNTVEGAVPVVGPNGEIYVSWMGPAGLMFDRSLDQGVTWLNNDVFVTNVPGGWDFSIPGINRCNGLPITMCDTSGGAHSGNIYINWSDQRNGITNTDIWLARSTDGGNTWSVPKKVNTDNTNTHQFFSWATVDQSNGDIYVVYYDRRNYTDSQTDVYIAKSTDGGNTFIDWKISNTPFLPNASVFFGDYTNITAHNGIVRPIWTRLQAGQLSVWTDISINNGVFTKLPEENVFESSFMNYPNPGDKEFYVSYKLRNEAKVSMEIFNSTGNCVAKCFADRVQSAGKYVEALDSQKLGLSEGIYFIKLSIDGQIRILKQVVN